MLGGGVDAATLVAALGAGLLPPECRWGRRPHRGATACRETKKHSPNAGARANNALHRELGYPVGEPSQKQRNKALTLAHAQTIH